MDPIESLENKIKLAAEQILYLKNEKHRLESEVGLLKNKVSELGGLKKETQTSKRDKERLRLKLDKLNSKLEKWLNKEAPVAMNGEAHE